MLAPFDYVTVILYFVFMVLIGFVFRTFISDSSDYFRGGGRMLWWMTGSSSFMMTFSAWTFTGAASSAYQNGPLVLVIFLGNTLGFLVSYFYFAARFRQLRVITPIQAMRQRFGRSGEQFFTWAYVPTNVVQSGIWLGGLGIFCSAVFGFDLQWTIIATGVVVVFVALLGGSWAVVASDFMQVLVLLPISIVLAVYALIDIGGVERLIERFPAETLAGRDIHYSTIVAFWIAAVLIQKVLSLNNMMDAYRYLTARDSENARKASLLAGILFLVGPIIWFIPPMVAAVMHPDLSETFPQLGERAHEAAYVVMGLELLPAGMVGVLVAAIFAATMSSMDSGLNRNAGILVKDFYESLLRPKATEVELVLVGKIVTAILGGLIIGAALWQSQLESIGLFDIMLQFAALIALPLSIPMFWGALIKRTPDWSGWSTAVFGFFVSLVLRFYFSPEWLNRTFHLEPELTTREANDYVFLMAVFVNTVLPSLWFFGTMLFYRHPNPRRHEQRETMFRNMNTPVEVEGATVHASDTRQASVIGRFALGYGFFLALLALVPNTLDGRVAFLFCGGVLCLIGWALLKAARKAAPPEAAGT